MEIDNVLTNRLGKTSVRYAVALFPAETASRTTNLQANDFSFSLKMLSQSAAAYGEMTHVFVDPKSRRPVDIDPTTRKELEKLVVQVE
jgi:acyl-CoA thioester hydrolase